ncbi:hypothetical protein [Leptospira interrogans]|uniref:Uncharacterized protein n=1 Tax=Leptospira interrogans serovar Zanoni str. LT2156 TaxID=1001601 RepID=M6HBP7_LEPIR|nr:hypothetical protein [Leptospira interrogans]EMM94743.1 hypothetical protein LEP1GSC158_1760 [Leptospira interrogans serovar Zanoni str. LT2156]
MDGFGTSSKVIEAACFSLSETIGVTIHKPEINRHYDGSYNTISLTIDHSFFQSLFATRLF